MNHAINVNRVYEQRSAFDGRRVLVDRVWPRGLSRSAADLDDWCKEIAPSTELRQWYRHQPSRWAAFQQRYLAELADPAHSVAVAHLRSMATHQDLTLLTATRDITTSHAAVLAQYLLADSAQSRRSPQGEQTP